MRPPREVDKPTYEIVGRVERYDQRDHPNARMAMSPGGAEFADYYARRPELKEWDDENRRVRAKAVSRRRSKDPVNEWFGEAAFFGRKIMGARDIVGGVASASLRPGTNGGPVEVDPGEMSRKLKAFGCYLGAGKVRITRLNSDWVCTNYAHPYTPAEPYGAPVELDYKYVICMAIPQRRDMILNGFGVAMATEGGWNYSLGSLYSVTVAQFIRSLGWPARALPPDNSPYLVVPTFVDAGIGEQGRCGHVVSKEFGNNFRPGAVATDMPLDLDRPVDFGLQDFCEKCLICAEACPSGAISKEGKQVVRGVRRWHFDGNKCRRFWDSVGGSCSICQAVCPWSHPSNWFHNTIRELSDRLPVFRKVAIYGERAVYGKFRPRPAPDWMKSKGIPS
ncbi:MAG: reductive dehalogenase [Chloroflexi bacterium]|nr:reductive dehalogenase [Chloroflexota bacterium]